MSSLSRRLFARPVGRPLERLEDRSVPASLVTLAADGISPLNSPVDVLATSDDGRYLLFQTKATNVVTGQIDPVGTTDLFWRDTSNNVTLLVSGADGKGGARSVAVGVEPSNPGVKNNAVLSANGQTVAFLSGANASKYDSTLSAVLDDGGLDGYRWTAPVNPSANAATTVTLASRDRFGFAIGSYAGVDNVGVSADGSNIGFVSDVNPYTRIDSKFIAGKKQSAIDIAPDGPNLFVQNGSGNVPLLISYLWTAFNSLDPMDTSVDWYRQYSDVSVDPLGRYMSAAGVSFVMTRDYRNDAFFGGFSFTNPFGLNTNITGGKDAWRFSFAGVGQPAARDLIQNLLSYGTGTYTDPATGLPVTEGFASAGLSGYGTVNNAYIARDRGDVAVYTLTTNTTVQRSDGSGFTFDPVTGQFIPAALQTVAANFQPVPGYVPGSTDRTDLFVARFGGASGNVQFGYNSTLVSGRFGSATQGQGGTIGSDDFRGTLDPSGRGFVLSSDGSKITYTTSATDVLSGVSDKNRARDVFQFNVETGETRLVSVSAAASGFTAQGDSYNPLVTQDAQLVGFESTANDLTVDTFNNRLPDTNGVSDIFVRDVASKVTTQASLIPGNGAAGNAKSYNPVLGGTFQNGKVYYTSAATDLDVTLGTLPATTPPQGYGTNLPLLLPKLPRFTAYSGGGGQVTFATTNLNGTLNPLRTVQPFGKNYVGELRVATGDYNGDGTIDVIVGSGPGGGPRVAVLDGATGRTVKDFFAFEPRFLGGVYVALGDVTGDGKAEIIVGAGEGGGPRVQITDSASDRVLVDAFVYESQFRGGARVAAGDVTGDGRTDLITGAGIGGGPRVTVFDGTALPTLNVYTNFFAFEPSLRGGAYVSAGDYDGDGKADLVAGAGPDGGPRVTIFDAANIVLFDPNKRTSFADFFAFDPDSRNGARPALKDIDGDGQADLVVGTGNGFPLVKTFSGALRGSADTSLQQLQTLNPFSGTISLSGAWVG